MLVLHRLIALLCLFHLVQICFAQKGPLQVENGSIEELELLHQLVDSIQQADLDFERVLSLSTEGVALALKLDRPQLEADFHRWIIRSNSYLFRAEQSYKSHRRTEELYSQGDIQMETYLRSVYGEAYTLLQIGEFAEAQQKLLQLKELGADENVSTKIYYLDLLATLEIERENYGEAEGALVEMLNLAKEGEVHRNVSIGCIRLTTFHLENTEDFDSALRFATDGIEHAEVHGMASYVSHLRLLKARTHLSLKNFPAYKEEFSKIKLDPSDAIFPKDYWMLQGDYHSSLGQHRLSIEAFNKALAFVDTTRRTDYLEALDRLNDAHRLAGNFEQAYAFQQKSRKLDHRIAKSKNAKTMNYFENKINDANARLEMLAVEKELRAQRNRFRSWSLLIGVIVLMLGAWIWQVMHYNHRLKKDVAERTEILNLKSVALEKNLDELRQFNYIASHDIKEPMRVVSNLSGLIQKGIGEEHALQFQDEFGIIKRNLSQLYTLLEDITKYNQSADAEIALESVDLNVLFTDITSLYAGELENQHIQIDPLPMVHSSRALLVVVFKNLIENAIKFTADATPLKLIVSCSEKQDSHTVHVEDNGPGVAPEYREKAFEMFSRLHGREIPGSGMGLGIARKTMEQLGGSIRLVNPRSLGGAHVEVSIPRRQLGVRGI